MLSSPKSVNKIVARATLYSVPTSNGVHTFSWGAIGRFARFSKRGARLVSMHSMRARRQADDIQTAAAALWKYALVSRRLWDDRCGIRIRWLISVRGWIHLYMRA